MVFFFEPRGCPSGGEDWVVRWNAHCIMFGSRPGAPLLGTLRPIIPNHSRGAVPTMQVYMGKDKFENEDLIRYGLPTDLW